MNDRARLIGLAGLLVAGISLVVALSVRRVDTPLRSSLAPAFQLLGTPVKAVDHLVTRVIPVDDLDEQEFGEVLKARYDAQANQDDRDFIYLNDLMAHLSDATQKPFEYRVYVLEYAEPNAMALPGGVVLVTSGLLQVLQSEAELVAVLAHEVGHIERGHCLDAVKFQLLAEKVGERTFGDIVDFAVRILVAHSFSKTQEDDADEYAYTTLLNSPYDPRGVGMSFTSLIRHVHSTRGRDPSAERAEPIRDYFLSHPPLEVREAKFRERAAAWWRRHEGETRQIGEENLRLRSSVYGQQR